MSRASRSTRDRYVDFLRAWAIVLVVFGHWLITGLVRGPGGEISAPELLATLPWTQWLTLFFQVMPLFFLAAWVRGGRLLVTRRGRYGRMGEAAGRAAAAARPVSTAGWCWSP